MIILNTKTFEELKVESTSDLQAVGFDTSPGAIAKLFMNIVNKNIANLYNKNMDVTLIDAYPQILSNSYDLDYAEYIKKHLTSKGIKVFTNTRIIKFNGKREIIRKNTLTIEELFQQLKEKFKK